MTAESQLQQTNQHLLLVHEGRKTTHPCLTLEPLSQSTTASWPQWILITRQVNTRSVLCWPSDLCPERLLLRRMSVGDTVNTKRVNELSMNSVITTELCRNTQRTCLHPSVLPGWHLSAIPCLVIHNKGCFAFRAATNKYFHHSVDFFFFMINHCV